MAAGNIYYTKCGSGKPLLLIHDLHFASSGYEWESIREQLSRSYTVYTLDLLGCGRSEKPNPDLHKLPVCPADL